jgi:hypothetical protein
LQRTKKSRYSASLSSSDAASTPAFVSAQAYSALKATLSGEVSQTMPASNSSRLPSFTWKRSQV